MPKEIEFNLLVVETPETSPDRARLIQDLTEGEIAIKDSADETANYSAIADIAECNNYNCIWFGTNDVYLWPKALGPDPIKAFQGIK
jgi:hypothetical protein